MKIKKIFKNIVSSKTRFLLTIIGILISAMLLFTLSILKSSIISNLFHKYEYFHDNKAYIIGDFDNSVYNQIDKSFEKTAPVTLQYIDYSFENQSLRQPYRVQMYLTTNELFDIGLPNIFTHDLNIFDNSIIKGASWTRLNDINGDNVIIIDEKSSYRIFKKANPVGKPLNIHGEIYTIIGVSKTINELYLYEDSGFDNLVIFMPVSTYKKNFQMDYINKQIVLKEKNTLSEDYITKKIFTIRSQDMILDSIITREKVVDSMSKTYKLMFTLINSFTIVSFIISGFSLMNTMFFNVKERIREIGIRKAVGASNQQILLQFLFEALILSILGILVGFGLSILCSLSVLKLMKINFVVNFLDMIKTSFLLISISSIFSFFPAKAASNLEITNALKFE